MRYLITGGTGTLGQALVKELLAQGAERVCVFSRDEHKQFEMQEAITDSRLRWFIGDVRDGKRLLRAFAGIDKVIHAAAMKHVKASEYNPFECVKTNVNGAQNVIEAALDAGIAETILVSTDKAVDPTTLYGATKLTAERMFLSAHSYAGKRGIGFGVVRLGNIAFSRGSVIPKWREILKNADTVPVSDPECTRYWITQADAARYVISAKADGHIHSPAMPAYRLGDLAEAIGAKQAIVGLGKGERLHEAGSERARRLTVEELRGLIA